MEKNSLFHLGSMNWEPNIEGVNWFLENIAPALNKDLPDVKIYLAGRNMPQTLYDKHPENVVVVGEVEDAYSFMCSKQIMFIPLLSGSGMRIKLIEAMTLCKPVISTSIGAEGVEVENGKDIVIADTPDEMIFRIKQLFNNPEAANFIGQNAGEKAKKYNIKQIFDSFENFINTNLTNSNG
jgi:polysaccharide biosynthesis protein PslH